MSSLPLTRLLEPISEAAPSGNNLEYDPRFIEMEQAAQPTAEQQYGSTIIEGKEPEWHDVQDKALELLGEAHDLRVALQLSRALLRTEGLAGFRDGLALIHGYVEKFWPTVHPQLDPDDDNDPTMRVNTLAGLLDNTSVLIPLKKTPLVSSRNVGQFSRLDLAYASGEIPFTGPAEEKPKSSLIDAAFQDCPLEKLQSDTQAAIEAVEHLRAIELLTTKQVGAGDMRSLDVLTKELDVIRKILVERLSHRTPAVEEAPAPAVSNGAASGPKAAASPVQAAPVWNGEITSRSQAIKAIESVCRYFERYEPSSPLPLLLHRAMRLSSKSFLEIMRDISPDGLTQAESLGGMSSEEYAKLAAAPVMSAPPSGDTEPARPSSPAAGYSPPSDDY